MKLLLVLPLLVEAGMTTWMLADFFARGNRLSLLLAGLIGALLVRTWRTLWRD